MTDEKRKDNRRKSWLAWGFSEEEINKKEEQREQHIQQKKLLEAKAEKIISAMMQQCADEGLTYEEARDVASEALRAIEEKLSNSIMNLKQSRFRNQN